MIGALSYFGVLSPSKLLPDRCNFGSEFGCKDFSIFGNGINLKVKNDVGVSIVIENAIASNENLKCASPTISLMVKSGEIKDIFYVCDISGYGFPKDEKMKLNLEINYHLAGSSNFYSKKVLGEVYSTVHGSIYEQINTSHQVYT